MAAFSYEHLFDPAHSTPLFPLQAEDMFNGPSCFFHNQKPHDTRESSSATESRCSLGSATEPKANYSNNAVDISEPLGISMEKKRKNTDGSCGTCAQSNENSKGRKQKKPSTAGGLNKVEGKKKKEAPEGYIHVRARRGQATDSHSLAERVRREKISERMKLLQALVPGCDKLTGKALMLDEIINYVQSLQNQVEFLSMKLASVNPTLYDFSVDFDEQMNQLEKVGGLSQDSQLSRLVNQSSHLQDRACDDATKSHPSMQDTSSPFLLNEQGPISFSQYNGNLIMQVGEQGQGFLDQALLGSKCSFQWRVEEY